MFSLSSLPVDTCHKNSRNNPAVNSLQIQEFLKALAGGVTVVLLIQSINTILGAAILSRPPYLPHPFDAMKWLKGCAQLLLVVVKGLTAATFVVFVEEVLFRSWMPNEIAIDTGYHQSIIITGLVFALFQRYFSLFQSISLFRVVYMCASNMLSIFVLLWNFQISEISSRVLASVVGTRRGS